MNKIAPCLVSPALKRTGHYGDVLPDDVGLAQIRLDWHVCPRVPQDVLYEAMNRDDWTWRSLPAGIAQTGARALSSTACDTAIFLDDSIKECHGKKMPGISGHFDHTRGRNVMGWQSTFTSIV
ncbi:MAG TPA: hypothetical protein PLB25_14395 [Rhodoferax sp.]|nr:hypothetical protein [Rhodoferax sp.]